MSDKNLINLSNVIAKTITVSDPKFTFTDWNNFNGSDWVATQQNCYQFGEIIVIVHKEISTLKIFIAKELASAFGYSETKGLTRLVDPQNVSLATWANLKEIKGLEQIFENQGRDINPQGMKLVNYAGFHHAITDSSLEPAKIIRAYVYGNILPSVSETGKFNSNESNESNHALEKETKDVAIPIELQNILDKAFTSFFELYSKQNEIINKLSTKIENIENYYHSLVKSSDNIQRDQKYLLYITKFNIPNKFFTLEEVCYYLNTYYKRPNDQDMTIKSLKRFLVNIKMLKGNFVPYVGFSKSKFIIEKASPFGDNTSTLELSKDGVDYIIEQLQESNYI